MTNPYQMVINNVAIHIRAQHVEGFHSTSIDVFEAARTIAIGFCKMQEDVLLDLVHADIPQHIVDKRAEDLQKEVKSV